VSRYAVVAFGAVIVLLLVLRGHPQWLDDPIPKPSHTSDVPFCGSTDQPVCQWGR
jgi:hypothetical protein